MSSVSAIPGCQVLPPLRPREPSRASTCTTKRSTTTKASSARFPVLNAFVDATMRQLNGTPVKVWFILFRDTKPNGLARVSNTDLARRAGVTERAVRLAKRRLIDAGLVEVVRRGSLETGASVYRVRPLVAEQSFRVVGELRRQNPRNQDSAVPERDQKGHPDPEGSDAHRQKTRRRRSRKVA